MTDNDRADVASLPVSPQEKPEERDGIGAVVTLVQQDREALKRLCDVGRMIRRNDGGYGTGAKTLITNAVAIRLKQRGLAVPGFNKDMFPSIRGKELNAEGRK
jgi:hypothetical protein